MNDDEKFWIREGTTESPGPWREVTADEWWEKRGVVGERGRFWLPDNFLWGECWWSAKDDGNSVEHPYTLEGWYFRDGSHPDDDKGERP